MNTDWRPDAGVQTARARAGLQRRVRDYFDATGALEVDTPSLSSCAVSDPNIESVAVALQLEPDTGHYLHTSPEFAMKRLLAAGYPDIYQVCKVYRDGEAGRNHQPEFTMIEWYRLYADLERIIDDSLGLLAAALERPTLPGDATRISYRDAFLQYAGLDPLTATPDELARAADADAELRSSIGDRIDDWRDLVLELRVVPNFAAETATVVTHYPASQAALARLNPVDVAVADRFEVFIGSCELANGYVELTDGNEQRRRVQRDQQQRQHLDRPIRPPDNAFLAAVDSGMPPCSGVAAGLDRLLMVATGHSDIRQVSSFAYGRRR